MYDDKPYSLADGDVRFTDSTGKVATSFPDTETLAVAFDEADGILHKHGREERVSEWAAEARRKFLSAGFDELVQSISVVAFPATPETIRELNACIAISGRVKDIVRRFSDIEAKERRGFDA
jgi:DNA polymerase II small subunit/DNA polymerase delta subunit B